MADLSKLTLPNGNTYDIKDEVARKIAAGGITFQGVTTTVIRDDSTVTSYKIEDETRTAANGDLVIYEKKEFVYSAYDSAWHELGDNSAFKALAYADEASTSYTPAGNISQATFTGNAGNVSVTGTPEGTVRITKGEGETNYTPEGTVSKPDVNVELNTANKFVASSATGGGTVIPGSAAECTLPNLEFTVTGETLNINWTDGSFTPNTPTGVTLPTFAQQTIATGVKAAGLDKAPVFTGTAVDLEGSFTGTSMESTGNFTPEGSINAQTFNGTQTTITVQ